MQDTGLGVRKRVVKLLKALYLMTDDLQKKIDICSKIILRMLDEDDTVKVGRSLPHHKMLGLITAFRNWR